MWNYRIIKRLFNNNRIAYEICEVYYNKETGDIESWTGGIAPQGEDLKDLKLDFGLMIAAFHKPILEERILPNGKKALELPES